MAVILLFDANNEASLFKKKIKNGCVTVEGKQFIVDESEPLLLRSKMGGYTPLYILKWDTIEPSTNINPRRSFRQSDATLPTAKTKPVTPKFDNRFGLTPDLFKKMMGMQILGNMIKPKKELPNALLLILGIIIGVMIMFSMSIMGVLG